MAVSVQEALKTNFSAASLVVDSSEILTRSPNVKPSDFVAEATSGVNNYDAIADTGEVEDTVM